MSKILTLAWKELYTTYTDRNLVLIMIVTPLALATIIGMAFSGFLNGGNDVPIHDIPVVIVNLDTGTEAIGQQVNAGDILTNLLIPPEGAEQNTVLLDLTEAIALDSPEAARAGVDDGTYAAAIIIPEDFTRNMTYSPGNTALKPTSIEVYASPAQPISASIIRSIVEGVGNQIATGNITIAATIGYLVEKLQADWVVGLQMLGFSPDFAPAFDSESLPLKIDQQTVTGAAATFNPLVYFGAAQAVFFMMFAAQGGAQSVLEEQRDGTLQRMIASPTPRVYILLGKLIGTFCSCVFQMVLLFLFLTIIGSLMSGQLQFIWGQNLLLIALTIIAAALAASGLGALITSLVRSPQQADVVGGAVVMAMGILGGTFFNLGNVGILSSLSRLTLNYWATQAFTALAQNQNDIGLNLILMLVLGGVMFGLGVMIFNRRLDV